MLSTCPQELSRKFQGLFHSIRQTFWKLGKLHNKLEQCARFKNQSMLSLEFLFFADIDQNRNYNIPNTTPHFKNTLYYNKFVFLQNTHTNSTNVPIDYFQYFWTNWISLYLCLDGYTWVCNTNGIYCSCKSKPIPNVDLIHRCNTAVLTRNLVLTSCGFWDARNP